MGHTAKDQMHPWQQARGQGLAEARAMLQPHGRSGACIAAEVLSSGQSGPCWWATEACCSRLRQKGISGVPGVRGSQVGEVGGSSLLLHEIQLRDQPQSLLR